MFLSLIAIFEFVGNAKLVKLRSRKNREIIINLEERSHNLRNEFCAIKRTTGSREEVK